MRTFDPVLVNAMVNAPTIRGAFGYHEMGPLDLAPALADERNICLIKHGVMLWFIAGDAGYEVHCMVGQPMRGRRAVAVAREMLASVPGRKWCAFDRNRRDVRMFAAACGFATASACGTTVTMTYSIGGVPSQFL